MSLHLSRNPPSKREKQEMFKKSLDDQRRIKQESASRKEDIPGHGPPGSSRNVAGVYKTEFKAIPGLDHRERFEGAAFARKKQPYMSAVSASVVTVRPCFMILIRRNRYFQYTYFI